MKKIRIFVIAVSLLAAFALWTLMVSYVDVQAIGPRESSVGFSSANAFVHKLTGIHFTFYHITDWMGLVPVAVCLVFAVVGLIQWIQRKNILKVDANILILGVFYIITIAAYLLFESVVINYRPVLINGYLEASYPSSTTLLVLCVMPTTIMQCKWRIKNSALQKILVASQWAFIAFMVIGRIISGVHWITDIIGGCLLSGGLVMLYFAACKVAEV